MKKLLWIPVVLSLIACKEEVKEIKQPPKAVKSMLIKSMESKQDRNFAGKVVANVEANLSFQVSGKLIKLPIIEGRAVKKGDLLAAIETKRYVDGVSQAQAKFDLAKAQYDRAHGLVKKDYISRAEYDIMKSNMDIANAALSTAQKDLKDTVLYAPFDGLVAKKNVDNHEYVKAKETILSYYDLQKVDIEIQIPEYIAMQADGKNNATAYAIFDSNRQLKLPLKFKEYSSKADQDTNTFKVVFTLSENEKVKALPGMSVTVQINVPDYKNNKKSFYLIPSSSVFSSANKNPQVWLINPKTKKISAQDIKVSTLTGNQIKVMSGLKSGDLIVTAGVNFLRSGDEVNPLDIDKAKENK